VAETADEKKPARRSYGFVARVIAVLGILQLYNIVAHHQTLLDLSESVQLLAAWWRHLLGELFGFLRIDLPPLQRELLSLLILSGSAANFAFFRKHGSFLFAKMLRETLLNPDADYSVMFGVEQTNPKAALGFALMSVILLSLAIAVVAALPLWAGAYCVFAIIILFILLKAKPSDDNIIFLIVLVLASPLIFMLMWIVMTASYFREIFQACRYLLLLLAADLAFRYIIDPWVAPWISSLPAPPGA
jgi:hypothetical protein